MEFKNIKFDFDDITIVPEVISPIRHRFEINPFMDGTSYLPIMTAPMDTVVDIFNYRKFIDNNIVVAFPRGVNFIMNDEFSYNAISLDTAESLTVDATSFNDEMYLIIDTANGNMRELYEVTKRLMILHPTLKLIIGNIANPKTYEMFAELGVYGCRIGIGGGGSCTTSANIAIHYPMGSLIQECYEIKKNGNYNTKIISDGGMRKYSDIIKSLALGADMVMIGSMFNKMIESCSDTYLWKIIKVSGLPEKWLFKYKFPLYKKFRGMSTKEVQKKWGNKTLRTAEGIVKWNKVEYQLDGWVRNFKDYLRSAMSYTGSYTLEEFKESEKVLITENAYRRFNK